MKAKGESNIMEWEGWVLTFLIELMHTGKSLIVSE